MTFSCTTSEKTFFHMNWMSQNKVLSSYNFLKVKLDIRLYNTGTGIEENRND